MAQPCPQTQFSLPPFPLPTVDIVRLLLMQLAIVSPLHPLLLSTRDQYGLMTSRFVLALYIRLHPLVLASPFRSRQRSWNNGCS